MDAVGYLAQAERGPVVSLRNCAECCDGSHSQLSHDCWKFELSSDKVRAFTCQAQRGWSAKSLSMAIRSDMHVTS